MSRLRRPLAALARCSSRSIEHDAIYATQGPWVASPPWHFAGGGGGGSCGAGSWRQRFAAASSSAAACQRFEVSLRSHVRSTVARYAVRLLSMIPPLPLFKTWCQHCCPPVQARHEGSWERDRWRHACSAHYSSSSGGGGGGAAAAVAASGKPPPAPAAAPAAVDTSSSSSGGGSMEERGEHMGDVEVLRELARCAF